MCRCERRVETTKDKDHERRRSFASCRTTLRDFECLKNIYFKYILNIFLLRKKGFALNSCNGVWVSRFMF